MNKNKNKMLTAPLAGITTGIWHMRNWILACGMSDVGKTRLPWPMWCGVWICDIYELELHFNC
jgi:hypothetical protein